MSSAYEPDQPSQESLIEFLSIGLDFCLTLLQSARLTGDPEHYAATLDRARSGLTTVRSLTGRVRNAAMWYQIHNRANELERQLAKMPDRPMGRSKDEKNPPRQN